MMSKKCIIYVTILTFNLAYSRNLIEQRNILLFCRQTSFYKVSYKESVAFMFTKQKASFVFVAFLLFALFAAQLSCKRSDTLDIAKYFPNYSSSTRVPSPDDNIGYVIPDENNDSSSGTSCEPDNSSSNPVTSNPRRPINRTESGGSSSSKPSSSPVTSIPVNPSTDTSSNTSSDVSTSEPGTIDDPIIITEIICYEWSETSNEIFYLALQLQNTAAVPMEILSIDLTMFTNNGSIESKDSPSTLKTYFSEAIEPGKFGYSVTRYTFNPNIKQGGTGTYIKNVTVKVNQQPTEKTRKELDICIYDLESYPFVNGQPLHIKFDVCNQHPTTIANIKIEIILWDENNRFIGIFSGFLPSLGSEDEYNYRNVNTQIFYEFVPGKLYKVEGVAYVYEDWG